MDGEDGWDKFYRAVIEGVKKGANQLLDQFRVSLGDWLWAMLNWPTPDWREQLDLFVEHTRNYGLVIEPDTIRRIHDLVEARVNGTGPFAALGPYGAGTQRAASASPVTVAMSVGLAKASATDATVTTDSGQSIAMADGTGVVDAAPVARAQAESSDVDQPFIISVIPDVSGPGPEDAAAKTGSPPVVATKPHLPADSRGTWIDGRKGNGIFQYNDSPVNRQAGIAGARVRFLGQHIAEGGFPAETYYGGSAAEATVSIETVTATSADNAAADAAMRAKRGDPTWRRPKGYRWNHAGRPGSNKMELVDFKFHRAIAHKGSAAQIRAERRVVNARERKGTGGTNKGAKGGVTMGTGVKGTGVKGKGAMGKGATGRALTVVGVYLTARDALQAAGILQPDYHVSLWVDYYFVANDGSVFVVWPRGWFSSAKREFVAGPRAGQKETLSKGQVEEYRTMAEEKWGRYIPGNIFREPRFVPGTDRKSLPLFEEDAYGLPREVGWIDENGVHRYSVPKPGRA